MTGDESYHANCFTCKTCKRRIDELVFAKTSQGIYCMVSRQETVSTVLTVLHRLATTTEWLEVGAMPNSADNEQLERRKSARRRRMGLPLALRVPGRELRPETNSQQLRRMERRIPANPFHQIEPHHLNHHQIYRLYRRWARLSHPPGCRPRSIVQQPYRTPCRLHA
jgi:hypothetical protein